MPCNNCNKSVFPPASVGGGVSRSITPVVSPVVPPIEPPPPPPPPECNNVLPSVYVMPPSGTEVQFPLVALLFTTEGSNAAIRYTTDGSEPVFTSPIYSGLGIIIEDQNRTLKAKAFLTNDCPPGPTLTATWLLVEDFQFSYLCTEADNTGRFPELDPPGFDPNGDPADSQWRMVFTFGAITEVVRVEAFQTDGFGNWNTGQAWATSEYVYPYQTNPQLAFHCYPLVIKKEPGAVQLENTYVNTLGNFAAAAHEWRLWGQQEIAPNGFYTFKVYLGNGRVIQSVIPANCVPPPPPCDKPPTPTLIPTCAPQITVEIETYTGGDIFTLYRRSPLCGVDTWTAVVGGATDSGSASFTYVDTDVVVCCTYEYYLAVKCPETNFYKASDVVSALVPCEGVISITSDRDETCAGDDVILAWISEHCDTVSIDNGIGVVDANGTITVNPLVTTTYTITCNNAACGNLTASVTITVNAVGTQGCGCWDYNENQVVTLPLQLTLIIKSDYNPAGNSYTLNLTAGYSPIGIAYVSYVAPNDNIVIQPGFCDDAETHTWVLQYQNSSNTNIYRGYLDSVLTPQGSYTRIGSSLGNYRDAVVS